MGLKNIIKAVVSFVSKVFIFKDEEVTPSSGNVFDDIGVPTPAQYRDVLVNPKYGYDDEQNNIHAALPPEVTNARLANLSVADREMLEHDMELRRRAMAASINLTIMK